MKAGIREKMFGFAGWRDMDTKPDDDTIMNKHRLEWMTRIRAISYHFSKTAKKCNKSKPCFLLALHISYCVFVFLKEK